MIQPITTTFCLCFSWWIAEPETSGLLTFKPELDTNAVILTGRSRQPWMEAWITRWAVKTLWTIIISYVRISYPVTAARPPDAWIAGQHLHHTSSSSWRWLRLSSWRWRRRRNWTMWVKRSSCCCRGACGPSHGISAAWYYSPNNNRIQRNSW